MRRVIANGGDIHDGDALDKALRENLTVVSVYGGDESTVGTYTLDETTHSVTKRDMGVFEYKDGTVTPKAFFGIGGEDFKTGLSRPAWPVVGSTGIVAEPWHELDSGTSRVSETVVFAVSWLTVRQLTVDGFFRGCSYGLLGVGFAMILGVTGRFHFAYGFTYTFAVYLAYTFTFRGRAAVLAGGRSWRCW